MKIYKHFASTCISGGQGPSLQNLSRRLPIQYSNSSWRHVPMDNDSCILLYTDHAFFMLSCLSRKSTIRGNVTTTKSLMTNDLRTPTRSIPRSIMVGKLHIFHDATRTPEYSEASHRNLSLADHDFFLRYLDRALTATIVNILVCFLRPVDWFSWQARVPRCLWELCIVLSCKRASLSIQRRTQTNQVYLLLFLLLAPTGLVDVFFWAPLLGLSACYDRHNIIFNGFGDLLVAVQCIIIGFIYIETGTIALDAYNRAMIHEYQARQERRRDHDIIRSPLTMFD